MKSPHTEALQGNHDTIKLCPSSPSKSKKHESQLVFFLSFGMQSCQHDYGEREREKKNTFYFVFNFQMMKKRTLRVANALALKSCCFFLDPNVAA